MQYKPVKTVLIVGCGYLGRRVAALLPTQDCTVTGVVRSQASVTALEAAGVEARVLDLDGTAAGNDRVHGFEGIFFFAPPPGQGDRDSRMLRFLQALDTRRLPRRIVYISTSAVYGDCKGAWIDESQPVHPATARGWRRLDAEQLLADWCDRHGARRVVLRVPGIYGPGKLPLARLRKGTPVLREQEAPYTNRIHADDLARICIAAMNSPRVDSVYNVSDGHPSNMTDYFFRVADAAGLPRPQTLTRAEAQQVLSPGMLSFLKDSRRMRNDKLLRELGITLQYPDLDTGLKACFV